MKNVLYISPDFNYSCGVSKLAFLTLSYFNKNPGYKTHFITNRGDSLERLNSLKNINVAIKPFSKGLKNIFYYSSFKNSIKKFCKKNEINIIHTYHRYPEFVSGKIAKKLNIKTVTSALSFVAGYKSLSFKSDKIICEVDYIKKMLVNNFNVPENKIIKMYLPAESFNSVSEKEREQLKRFLSLDENQRVILFIGKISYKKGYDKLIEAYKIVHAEIKNSILIMCGNVENKEFNVMRNELKIPVIVIPPAKDYYKYYQAADIIVLPSRVDPFPFVMIESGSHKKPFIGGNTGGIAEFIEDGVNGLLVDPENENELADKILFLLKNVKTAEEFGNNLFKKVNEKCGYDNYFGRVEEIYNSLLV